MSCTHGTAQLNTKNSYFIYRAKAVTVLTPQGKNGQGCSVDKAAL